VLHSSQTELSDRFAGLAAHDGWDTVAHRFVEGIPALNGAIATLCCDLHDIADGGDHSVVVGHVTSLEQAGTTEAEPLVSATLWAAPPAGAGPGWTTPSS
jgi:flavin reductase (DIM6/NTAB) family NADH-FMN oxidoreductase RutF